MKSQPNHIFRAIAGASLLVLAGLSAPAMADEDYQAKSGTVAVHVGPAALWFDSSGKFSTPIGPLAGADLHIGSNVTAAAEVEVYALPNVSVSLTVGIPPKTNVDGRGILGPVGELGSDRYGLGALTAKYHFNTQHRLQPFVGAGVARFISYKAHDGAVSNLEVDNCWGAMVQGGAEYVLTRHIGLYANISHAFLKTDARGLFDPGIGLIPVTARVTLDPTVAQAGIFYRF